MLKQALRLFFNILLLLMLLAGLIWHPIVIYGLSQGRGQVSIIWDAEPISDVLRQKNTLTANQRKKLMLINEIKTFAFDSIGINFSENYSDFYDQKNKPQLLTISACEPYELKPKEWTFPFLGTVSYIGYFDKRKAEREIRQLLFENYDVDVYTPSGWSTLGYFRDPVLSNMLKKPEGSLANLIIHELTHGTLYVKNNVTFNENLANFIGDKGAEQFLNHRFGADSKELRLYREGKEDEKCYTEYILRATAELEKLYASPTFKILPPDGKKIRKNAFFTNVATGVYKIGLHQPDLYFKFTQQVFFEGNAFFMAFKRYDSQYEFFEKEYKNAYNSNLKEYLGVMKELYPSL